MGSLIFVAALALSCSAAETNAVFIPHVLVVPEFTPPVLAAPKRIPAMRVHAAATIPAGGKSLTILRGEASVLPELPQAPESFPTVRRVRTADDEAREIYQRRHTLHLGATVFNRRISIVRWQHPDTGETYEAVCGFDIGLLAGIGQFDRCGETYSVVLTHLHLDLPRSGIFAASCLSDLASVSDDSIRILQGAPADATGTAPIMLVKELISAEKPRLQVFQAGRERHQQARAAWEKANPVPPRDEVIWLRPHRGSRYLAEPTPEARTR